MAWRLVIARHSLAHQDHALGDHERELTAEGLALAKELGAALAAAAIAPSLALCSSAARAAQTAEAALAAAGSQVEPSLERELFQCMHRSWIDQLRRIDANCADVLAVGHAPTVGSLITELSGQDVAMPACCAYLLEYARPWSSLGTSQPRTQLLFAGAS